MLKKYKSTSIVIDLWGLFGIRQGLLWWVAWWQAQEGGRKQEKPCGSIHCTTFTIHSNYEKLPETQLMRIHKQKKRKKNWRDQEKEEEEMGLKKQQSHQRRNICKNKRFLKGPCD